MADVKKFLFVIILGLFLLAPTSSWGSLRIADCSWRRSPGGLLIEVYGKVQNTGSKVIEVKLKAVMRDFAGHAIDSDVFYLTSPSRTARSRQPIHRIFDYNPKANTVEESILKPDDIYGFNPRRCTRR